MQIQEIRGKEEGPAELSVGPSSCVGFFDAPRSAASRTGLLVEVWLFLFFEAVATEEVGQVLREGGARHHGVAAYFHRLGLEIALDVGEEADDGGALLQLGLKLGDERERLGVRVVEIEDDEAGTVCLLCFGEGGDGFLIVLHEGDLDSEFAGGLLDLGNKEEVFDEEEDAGRRILGDGDRLALRVVDWLRVAEFYAVILREKSVLMLSLLGMK